MCGQVRKVKVHHDEATNWAAPPPKMMASFTGVVLLTVTACALLRSIAPESFLQGTQESASGSGSGDDQQALAPQVRKLHILCKSSQLDNDVLQLASEANDLPVCGDNELLTFEGSQLVCRRFRKTPWLTASAVYLHLYTLDINSLHAAERRCRCAEVPDVGTAMPPTPLTPQGTLMCHVSVDQCLKHTCGVHVTHQGCPVFEPPARGAFVCILEGDAVIYCSVYCENRYEFSTTPLNPYRCGIITRFAWTDFTNETHQELPRCTG